MRIVKVFNHELDLMTPTEGYERTPGLHASAIYNELHKKLNPKRYDQRDKHGNPLPLPEDRVGFGTRFEEALEPQLREKWNGTRPGEFVTQHERDCLSRTADGVLTVKVGVGVFTRGGKQVTPCLCGAGIIYSPDYIFNVPGLPPILGEFKLTWLSSKEFPHDKDRFDKWMTQIKFYLRNLRMNDVWVFPFWVNGGTDHVYHRCQPEFKRAHHLWFSDGECEQTHQRLVRFARKEGLLEAA